MIMTKDQWDERERESEEQASASYLAGMAAAYDDVVTRLARAAQEFFMREGPDETAKRLRDFCHEFRLDAEACRRVRQEEAEVEEAHEDAGKRGED